MRVLLQADMEGISWVTGYQELVPLCPAYWETGQARFSEEVAAAATGLLEGGASEVVVDDQHLGTGLNILAELLPAGAIKPAADWIYQQLPARGFDAVFQVGRHARYGTSDGFASHTQVPGMALAIDGRPISESHINAFRAGVPLLGVSGDARLGDQLDGALAGTPFLTTKFSASRGETRPAFHDVQRSLDAVRAFAADCARRGQARPVPRLPALYTLTARAEPAALADLAGQHGWEWIGPGEISVRCRSWWHDAEPAAQAVTRRVAAPYFAPLRGFDLSSRASVFASDPALLAAVRDRLLDWIAEPQTALLG